jgi:hypothetical protein
VAEKIFDMLFPVCIIFGLSWWFTPTLFKNLDRNNVCGRLRPLLVSTNSRHKTNTSIPNCALVFCRAKIGRLSY